LPVKEIFVEGDLTMTNDLFNIVQPLQIVLAEIIRLIPGLISGLVIFIATIFISNLVRRAVRKTLERRQTEPQVISTLSKIAYWSVMVLGITVSLQQVGFNLTAFLAGLGIAGFTIGFALQDVSKNFIAGLLLILHEPFDSGEVIEVAGYTGTVMEVEVRATQIRTLDGLIVIIPNADIFTNAITNYTRSGKRRVELSIGVAYEHDPEQVRQRALAAIGNIPGLLAEPTPEVIFDNFGDTTFDLKLYFWVDTGEISPPAAKDAGLVAVKGAFEGSGIEMPYPTQTLLVSQAT
jgi:small conductance mechanosensitive channel